MPECCVTKEEYQLECYKQLHTMVAGGLKMAIFSGRYFLDDLSLEIAH